MPDTGWIIAQSAVNDTGKGTIVWADPERVTADDGSNSTAILNINESNWLRSSHNFENMLPIDSVITGVEVRVQIDGDASSTERVVEVQLHNGTEFIGTAKTPNTTIPNSPTNLDFGASDDLWDAVLNLIQIGFCAGTPVHFGTRADSDGSSITISVDATWMKLHYLPKDDHPGGGPRDIGGGDNVNPGPPGGHGDFG